MVRKFIALLFPLFLLSCAQPEIKVMSFNLRYSTQEDGENWWEYRKTAVIGMVDSLRPDVIGTQECTGDMEDFLLENLHGYNDIYSCRESGDQMNNLFYNMNTLDLVDSGIFWLSETPDSMSVGWDAMFRRTVVWARLRHKETGREFFHFNTHLDHIGKIAREESVKLFVSRIPDASAFVITGDFNSTVDEPIFDPLKSLAVAVRDTAPQTDCKNSYNAFGKGTPSIIDHIFESGFQPLSFETLDGDMGVPYISDHYPILARMNFK